MVLLGRDPGQLVAGSELERIEKTIAARLETLQHQALPGVGREELRTSTPVLARLVCSSPPRVGSPRPPRGLFPFAPRSPDPAV